MYGDLLYCYRGAGFTCVNFASVSDMAGRKEHLCVNFEGDLEHEWTCFPIAPHIFAHEYILRGRFSTFP